MALIPGNPPPPPKSVSSTKISNWLFSLFFLKVSTSVIWARSNGEICYGFATTLAWPWMRLIDWLIDGWMDGWDFYPAYLPLESCRWLALVALPQYQGVSILICEGSMYLQTLSCCLLLSVQNRHVYNPEQYFSKCMYIHAWLKQLFENVLLAGSLTSILMIRNSIISIFIEFFLYPLHVFKGVEG